MSQGGTLQGPHEVSEGSRSATHAYQGGYTPFLDSVDRDMKSSHLTPMRLPSSLTTEDFTRAVAVATVSALRHQGSIIGTGSHGGSAQRGLKPNAVGEMLQGGGGHEEDGESGGHEAPSWTRGFSAGVLLGCTLLYALIAGEDKVVQFV